MDYVSTALILVGYQNDYFAKDGILRGVVEDPAEVDQVLDKTMRVIRMTYSSPMLIIATPIVLTPDYRAMASPVGILNTMKEVGAFKAGSTGAENIPQLDEFGDAIHYVTGKVGFNAFSNTLLGQVLADRQIKDVLVAGQVTSLCIDSTGRAAYERGYNVTIVSDCTSSRTKIEHDFFCSTVFPLYGRAATSDEILAELLRSAA
ncbi:MAG: cysteine hydrolase [Alphaproteobacteria bacterium]|nr:cysteine hydrolase [Alphaproteobacteria bacterium]